MASEKKPEVDDSNYSELQLGEYFLHVFVEETSSLNPKDDEDTINVLIEVQAFGVKKSTATRKGIGFGTAAFYGEHLFFDKNFKERSILDSQMLIVTVYDVGVLKRKIGSVEISIPSIYYEPEHTVRHRWHMLANIDQDFQKIMGYIKLSFNFVRSEEKRSLLVAEKSSEIMEGDSIRGLSIPPQFKLERKQIKIQVFNAERLVYLDDSFTQGKGSDPYLVAELGGTSIQTEIIKGSKTSAAFYETLYVTMIYPTFLDNLNLYLKDCDWGKKDEFFGSLNLKIGSISQGKYKEPRWHYFYGGWDDASEKDIVESMNKHPEIASRFKGAVFLSIEMIDAASQGNFKEKMQAFQIIRPIAPNRFRLCAEIYAVHNLHYEDEGENGAHVISIDWGGKCQLSRKVNLNCGMLEFYQYLELEEDFSSLELAELPNIVLTVMRVSKSQHVSYCRIKPTEYLSSEIIVDKYLMMNIDSAVSKLQDDGAGILHIKLGVNRSDRWNYEQNKKFDNQLVKPEASPIVISLNVFQAKELPSGDGDGSSDPVVVAYHYGTLARSSIYLKTLNPLWNERILIPSYIIGKFVPPLIINVLDYDKASVGKDSYEYLGSTHLFLDQSNLAVDYQKIPQPTWHKLKYNQESKVGRISLSATIITAREKAESLRPSVVKMNQQLSDHYVKIRILGLRNLQSTGLLPVKKPYIKINTGSLVQRSINQEDIPYTDLTTIPKKGGENPNIGEVLNLDLKISPADSMKPSISCQILDKALISSKDTVIGNFEIDLGYYSLFSKISLKDRLNILLATLKIKNLRTDTHDGLEKIISQLDEDIRTQINSYTCDNLSKEASSVKSDAYILNKAAGIGIQFDSILQHKEVHLQSNQQTLINIDQLARVLHDSGNKPQSQAVALTAPVVKKNEGIVEAEIDEEERSLMYARNRLDRESSGLNQDFEDFKDNVFVVKPKYKQKSTVVSRQKTGTSSSQNRAIDVADEEQPLKESENVKVELQEYDVPDPKKYRSIGYDSINRRAKHYRLFIENELEKSGFLGKSIFSSININRGKRIKSKMSWMEKVFSSKNQFRVVGQFRASINMIDQSTLQSLESLRLQEEFEKFDIPYSKQKWVKNSIDSDMLHAIPVQVRVYVLDAVIYDSVDIASESDPYLKLTLGDQVIDDSKNYIQDKNHPIFNKRFDLKHEFPGASVLKIQIFDKDILSDDIIGETSIDLEERFYNERYRIMDGQPVERRKIIQAASGQEIGYINLWVEIHTVENKRDQIGKIQKNPVVWDIESIPKKDYELRVIVWDTQDVPNNDPEDMSDIFVKVALNSLDNSLSGQTDTHIRSSDGFGSFNWRMKFPITIDQYSAGPDDKGKYRVDFQIWDKDVLTSNDFLSSVTLDFWDLVEESIMTESRAKKIFTQKGKKNSEFVLDTLPNQNLKDEKLRKPSKIRVSMELVPKEEAEKIPVGVGRGDPNQDPYLPPPVGRFQFTMNPFKLLNRLVGPAFKKKCCMIICCILCMVLCILVLPMLISNIIARAIIKQETL